MSRSESRQSASGIARVLVALLSSSVGIVVLWAVWSLPADSEGLKFRVFDNLEASGVENPITAVLLNFRSYDTLLEIGVLLLAVIGAQSLIVTDAPGRHPAEYPVGRVLTGFVQVLVPLVVVSAGYLLWVGTKRPGGAFQAGAILAAVVVLLQLAGHPLTPRITGRPLRAAMTVGFVIFLGVSVAVMVAGNRWLEYPPAWASELILLMEAAAMISIGMILAALFAGGRFEAPGENDSKQPLESSQ